MGRSQSRFREPRSLVTLVGIVVSVAFVILAVRSLDLRGLVDVWKGAKPFPWVLYGALTYILGHLVRGKRLQYLVRRDVTLPVLTASNIVIVGYASNNVLPARLGELVRAGMLSERTGMPLPQALTVTLIERLLDGVTIL